MKRLLTLVLLPLSLALPALAAAELNLAVLDARRAVLESQEAQSLLTALREELKPQEQEIRALNGRAAELQEKMLKDGEVMSDAEKRKIQKEVEDLQIEYNFKVQKLQKELQDRQQELFGQIAPRLDAVLKDLIEAEGYDLIVRRGTDVLFAAPKYDITAKVTEKLNER